MSIYRWAKLDDQSGPDRSIELKPRHSRRKQLPRIHADACGYGPSAARGRSDIEHRVRAVRYSAIPLFSQQEAGSLIA